MPEITHLGAVVADGTIAKASGNFEIVKDSKNAGSYYIKFDESMTDAIFIATPLSPFCSDPSVTLSYCLNQKDNTIINVRIVTAKKGFAWDADFRFIVAA